jgi:hypothetical protein
MGDFLTTYAAVRFSTGKKAPSITGNLLQAGAKLIWCGVLLLPALFQALRYLVWLSIDHTPPPVPQGAQRGAFQASIDDLTETMKD